jgi:hypothetical protein
MVGPMESGPGAFVGDMIIVGETAQVTDSGIGDEMQDP